MQGLINVYKPQDFTSHDCVAIVRRVSGIKKIGHTGTLDPMATGVLPVCVGKATRIIEYLDDDIKEYRCTMRLGYTSDTFDIWGNVTKTGTADNITKADITGILKDFEGEIMQTPPMYSALKINGRKLYEYARAGIVVDIKPRLVNIVSIEKISKDEDTVAFTVKCHKGTYIRSICNDAGELLGCGAVMTELERTATGIFEIKDSIDIRDIKNMRVEDLPGLLMPLEDAIGFNRLTVDISKAVDLTNGKKISTKDLIIPNTDLSTDNRISVFCHRHFVGVCRIEDDMIVADKIFNTELR